MSSTSKEVWEEALEDILEETCDSENWQPHVIKRTEEEKDVDVVSVNTEDDEARHARREVVKSEGEEGNIEGLVETARETEVVDKGAEEDEEDTVDSNQGLRLNERTILKLQEAFSLFDHDFDGKLSLHQTATMIRAVGLGLTEKNIAEILAEAPTAKIDFGTFLTSMADHLPAIRVNRAEEEAIAIRNAFKLIEETGNERGRGEGERGGGGGVNGTISRRRLTRLLSRVGEKLNKHEIDELLDDVGLGEVSPDEEIPYEALVEKIFEDY